MIRPDGLILDMDGVLWHGDEPLDGLVSFFDAIERTAIPLILATNNSTRTIKQYQSKLAGFGIQVRPDQLITSAYAAADHILGQGGAGTSVYAIGEEGLIDALTSRKLVLGKDGVDCVVVGLDRHLTYQKMAVANRLIRDGAEFIATNADPTFPTPHGFDPGAGAVLAGVIAATGVQPIVVGKPEPLMFQQALAALGTRPERTVMVGDRLDTDILGGQRAGVRTLLVLTGVTTHNEVLGSSIQPDWVLEDIRALKAFLEA